MQKQIFLIGSDSYKDINTFCEDILVKLAPQIKNNNPLKLKVTITETQQPRITLLPLNRKPLAMISITSDGHNYIEMLENFSIKNRYRLTGYDVSESPFVASEQYWQTGEVSPGLILLTIFRKSRKLKYETFKDIWFEEHSPLAVTIHPFYNYIRNIIDTINIEGSPHFDAIVEEHFIPDSKLLNPVKMFGGIGKFIPNMITVYSHVRTFIDLSSIENYICKEYHII